MIIVIVIGFKTMVSQKSRLMSGMKSSVTMTMITSLPSLNSSMMTLDWEDWSPHWRCRPMLTFCRNSEAYLMMIIIIIMMVLIVTVMACLWNCKKTTQGRVNLHGVKCVMTDTFGRHNVPTTVGILWQRQVMMMIDDDSNLKLNTGRTRGSHPTPCHWHGQDLIPDHRHHHLHWTHFHLHDDDLRT